MIIFVSRLSAIERRKELREYLNSVGIVNINKVALAKKYMVDEKTIRNDLALLMRKSDPEDLHQLLWRFDKNYQLALQGSIQAYRKSVTVREIVDSVKAIAAVTSEYLNSLAKLGYKVGENGAPQPKPSIEAFVAFLESPRYKQLREGRKTLPVPYDNLTWQSSSAAKKPEVTLPEAQESILEDEKDDLEEVTDEDIEIEEEGNECQK
jgi:hypothetical protein